MKLDLALDEVKLLGETLERAISELELEVVHTDNRDFKHHLKERHLALKSILEKLREAPVPA